MKVKISRELANIKHANDSKVKQDLIQYRLDKEIKHQKQQIGTFRNRISKRVKSEKTVYNSCTNLKGHQESMKELLDKKLEKVPKSVYQVESQLKRNIKPTDYKLEQ